MAKAIRIIAAEQALRYAVIMGSRFLEGEEDILKSPWISYRYAVEVIGGRFHEGEEVIAKDALSAYWYAMNVVNGRFHEGEEAILGASAITEHYLRNIFKQNTHTVDKKNPSDVELKFLSMMI